MVRMRNRFIAILVIFIAAGLLTMASSVSAGVMEGLRLCANVIIPSLFPFMVLSGFVALSGLGPLVAFPLRPITRYLLRLPDEAASVLLMSFIGGYPVGARTMATLLSTGRLSPQRASRMLCYCVNAGPSFLVVAVGWGFFRSTDAGWILLGAQILSALIIGAFLSRAEKEDSPSRPQPPMSLNSAFVQSVINASAALINTCAFVVLFCALIALIKRAGIISALENIYPLSMLPHGLVETVLSGFLEVTSGCSASATLPGDTAFLLVSFFVSFGGISIICQVASALHATGVDLRGFLLSRFIHGALTTAIAYPVYRALSASVSVFSPANAPTAHVTIETAITSVGMLSMAAILLLSVPTYGQKKRNA